MHVWLVKTLVSVFDIVYLDNDRYVVSTIEKIARSRLDTVGSDREIVFFILLTRFFLDSFARARHHVVFVTFQGRYIKFLRQPTEIELVIRLQNRSTFSSLFCL